MKLDIRSAQRALRVDRDAVEALLRWLLERAGHRMGKRTWHKVTLTLVEDRAMVDHNRAVFGKDTTTDVITLAYEPIPGESGWEAELIVNAACALREGTRRGSVAKELALYVAHAVDHLTGADDATPKQAAAMRRRELSWLRESACRKLLASLARH